MSADALAAFFAARGFAPDRDGVLVVSGDDEAERFRSVLDEARRELPASAFRGAAVHPAAPLDPHPRRSIPVRLHGKT